MVIDACATNCVTKNCGHTVFGVITCRSLSQQIIDNKGKLLISLCWRFNLSRRRSRVRIPSAPLGVPYGNRTRVAAVKETRFSYPTEIGTMSLPFVNWKHKPAVAANLWFKSQLTCDFTHPLAAGGSILLPLRF